MPNEETHLAPTATQPSSHDLLALFALLQSTLQDTARYSTMLSEFGKDLHEVAAEVSTLSRTLRGDGNGERGLTWRMMRMEEHFVDLRGKLDIVDKRLQDRGLAAETGRWSLTQAIIVAFITGMFLLGVAFVSGVLRMSPRP